MSSLPIPHKASKIAREFFTRHADEVAKDLLGRTLVFERSARKCSVYARIEEIAAYEGKQESMSEGALYAPGMMSISTKYGKNLIDIATLGICKPSCITLVGGTVYDERGRVDQVKGPGNLSAALGIDREYDSFPIDMFPIWIGGQPVDAGKILQRNRKLPSTNCRGFFYIKED